MLTPPPSQTPIDSITTASGKVVPVVVAMAPKNVAEMRETVEPGELMAAPRAAATGTINLPTGSPVSLILVSFWKNPTIRWWIVILAGAIVSASPKIKPLLMAKHIQWGAIWLDLKAEIVASVLAAIGAWFRSHDNNPVNLPGAAKEIKGESVPEETKP